MIGHDFPYIDTRDLNLDWVLKTIKRLNITIAEFLDHVPEELQEFVDKWLDEHPEATTTVLDGAIGYQKLNDELKGKIDDVGRLLSRPAGVVKMHRFGSARIPDCINVQGFTIYGGNGYMVGRPDADHIIIHVFNMETGETVATSAPITIAHGNSLQIYDNKLFVLDDVNDNWYLLSLTDFSIISSGNIGYHLISTAYYDGEMYGFGIANYNSIFSVKWTGSGFDANTYRQGTSVDGTLEFQSIFIKDDRLYTLSNWCIYECTFPALEIVQTYFMEHYADDLYNVGEVEDFAYYNGTLYCNSGVYMGTQGSTRYGGGNFLILQPNIVDWANFYSPAKAAPTRVHSYNRVFVCDDESPLRTYKGDGYAYARALCVTEAVALNPYYWNSLYLCDKITYMYISQDNYVEGNSQTIENLVVENSRFTTGTTKIVNLIAKTAEIILRGTVTNEIDTLNAENSRILANMTPIKSCTCTYSEIHAGSFTGTISNTRSKLFGNIGNSDLLKLSNTYTFDNAVKVVTNRGSYILVRQAGKFYAIGYTSDNYQPYLDLDQEGLKEYNGTTLADATIVVAAFI